MTRHKFYVDPEDFVMYLDGVELKGVKSFDLNFELNRPPKLALVMEVDYDEVPQAVLEKYREKIRELHNEVLGGS